MPSSVRGMEVFTHKIFYKMIMEILWDNTTGTFMWKMMMSSGNRLFVTK